jgi:uncharacterized protein YraI
MNCLRALVLAVATLVFPAAANAEVAYTTNAADLRAGPARDYPIVAILETGLAVDVQGCMQDYSWCDVIAGDYRGWVYARNIEYSYQGANVPVIDYGSVIGIGVVSFIIGSYWQDHYAGRPWYRKLSQWSQRQSRTFTSPGLPRQAATGAMHQPAPAFSYTQPPPRAGVALRQRQAEPHPEHEQHLAQASRMSRPQPSAVTAPRQPHVERPAEAQRHAPVFSHESRPRQ